MGIAKRSLIAAATIAGASAIALGAGTGTASAARGSACSGSTITGQGATLQTLAQGLWIRGFNAATCTGISVTYTGTGSGAGLAAWGASGTSTPAISTNAYIGTDDAPNATQLANIKTAASGADVAVVPVAQAAVAIAANIPSSCPVTQISNSVLEETYRGISHTWQDLPGGAGLTACNVAITPVVRQDASGTTFQFKQYLNRIHSTRDVSATGVSGVRTWEELQEITAAPVLNTSWPGTPVVPASRGGGQVVTEVLRTAGRIGYVNLADAVAGGASTLDVQNRTIGGVTYASPRDANSDANCSAARYINVPTTSGRSINLDWSRTYGVNPAVGGTTYPICVLTYDLALAGSGTATSGTAGYTTARYAVNGDRLATSVYDYLNYVTRNPISRNNYAGYPTGTSAVGTAALAAVAEIW